MQLCRGTNLLLGITVCHHLGSLVMPNGDPRDRFFYPSLTPMIYNTLYFSRQNCDFNVILLSCDKNNLTFVLLYSQGGYSLFSSYVSTGPASTTHPKNIRNFKHHKIIFEILATPKISPICTLTLRKYPKMHRNDS